MATYTNTFVAGANSFLITVFPDHITGAKNTPFTITKISIRKINSGIASNLAANEFLTGNLDFGKEIFFRADTQQLQVQSSPEMYSSPIAVMMEQERGTQTKTFISLDDKPFYQLEGTNTKGVSVLKPNASSNDKVKPPLAQMMQVSIRDSSKQRNRVLQLAIVSVPTTIDYAP